MGKPSELGGGGGRCRRHPKHRQSAGVCPFCLRERLSRLRPSALPAALRGSSSASSAASSASPYSSDGSDDEDDEELELSSPDVSSTPRHDVKRARLSLLMRQEERREGRPVMLASRRRGEEEEAAVAEEEERKEKRNFWAKLLPLRHGARRGGGGKGAGCSLAHAKTMKEKPAAKWVLF